MILIIIQLIPVIQQCENCHCVYLARLQYRWYDELRHSIFHFVISNKIGDYESS